MTEKLSEMEGEVKDWGTRFDILKHFYKLCPDPGNVLEIGVGEGFSFFDHLRVLMDERGGKWTGVDTVEFNTLRLNKKLLLEEVHCPHVFCRESSAVFWVCVEVMWDLIFVDGNHDVEYAKMDVAHALMRINPGGYILIHDIANEKYESDGPRKAYYDLCECRDDLSCELLYHDKGWMGVVKKKDG